MTFQVSGSAKPDECWVDPKTQWRFEVLQSSIALLWARSNRSVREAKLLHFNHPDKFVVIQDAKKTSKSLIRCYQKMTKILKGKKKELSNKDCARVKIFLQNQEIVVVNIENRIRWLKF